MNSFLSKFISKYQRKIATGVMILMLCLSMIATDTSADQKNIDFVQRDFNFLISDPAQDNKKACKPLSLQAFSTGAPDWEAKSL